jgi:hypothetical protein
LFTYTIVQFKNDGKRYHVQCARGNNIRSDSRPLFLVYVVFFYDLGRCTHGHRKGRDAFSDHSICSDDCVSSYGYIGHNNGIRSYPTFCLKMNSTISGNVLKHNGGVDIFIVVGIIENSHAGAKKDVILYYNAVSHCNDSVHANVDVVPYSQETLIGTLVFRVNIDTRISLNGDMVANTDKLRPQYDNMRGNGDMFAVFSKRQSMSNISKHCSHLTEVISLEMTCHYNRFDAE